MRRWLVHVADLALVALATISALLLRDNFEFSPDRFRNLLPYLMFTVVAASVILQVTRLDRGIWRFSTMNDYLSLSTASAVIVVCAVLGAFTYNRLEDVARALPILQFVLITAFLVGARVFYRQYRSWRADQRALVTSQPVGGETWVLLIGVNPISELYVKCARTYTGNRIGLAGVIAERPKSVGRTAYGVPVLGGIENIDSVLAHLNVQGITVRRLIVTSDLAHIDPQLKAALSNLHDYPDLQIEYFADTLNFIPPTERTAKVSEPSPDINYWRSDKALSSLEVLSAAASRHYFKWKRAIEAPIATALVLLAALPMLAIAIGTFLAVGAPILFWQFRPGYMGRRFRVFKFRTLHHAHDEDGQRVPDEQRYSFFGSLLRLTRMDELPQFVSIAAGHMSFIGPRPLILSEQADYPAARLLVRPGLTGWAQVNGGRGLSYEDKLALDFWYIAHASLKVDLLILVKTAGMILFGEQRNEKAIADARKEFGFQRSSMTQDLERQEASAIAASAR